METLKWHRERWWGPVTKYSYTNTHAYTYEINKFEQWYCRRKKMNETYKSWLNVCFREFNGCKDTQRSTIPMVKEKPVNVRESNSQLRHKICSNQKWIVFVAWKIACDNNIKPVNPVPYIYVIHMCATSYYRIQMWFCHIFKLKSSPIQKDIAPFFAHFFFRSIYLSVSQLVQF